MNIGAENVYIKSQELPFLNFFQEPTKLDSKGGQRE